MGIQTAYHAFNGGLKQFGVGDIVDVEILDRIEGARELADLGERQGRRRLFFGVCGKADGRKNTGADACAQQGDGSKLMHDFLCVRWEEGLLNGRSVTVSAKVAD